MSNFAAPLNEMERQCCSVSQYKLFAQVTLQTIQTDRKKGSELFHMTLNPLTACKHAAPIILFLHRHYCPCLWLPCILMMNFPVSAGASFTRATGAPSVVLVPIKNAWAVSAAVEKQVSLLHDPRSSLQNFCTTRLTAARHRVKCF